MIMLFFYLIMKRQMFTLMWGRRRLFKDLDIYKKVFVFENPSKFKSYKSYDSYEKKLRDLKSQYEELFLDYNRSKQIYFNSKTNINLKMAQDFHSDCKEVKAEFNYICLYFI